MALFGTSKKKKEEAAPASSAQSAAAQGAAAGLAHILTSPRITEKASDMRERGVYAFDVAPRATKPGIIAAVKKAYGVSPRAVRIVTIPRKQVRHMRTGKYGMSKGGKKAYVYLKKGETITIA